MINIKTETNVWVVQVIWVPGDIIRITQTNFRVIKIAIRTGDRVTRVRVIRVRIWVIRVMGNGYRVFCPRLSTSI